MREVCSYLCGKNNNNPQHFECGYLDGFLSKQNIKVDLQIDAQKL